MVNGKRGPPGRMGRKAGEAAVSLGLLLPGCLSLGLLLAPGRTCGAQSADM